VETGSFLSTTNGSVTRIGSAACLLLTVLSCLTAMPLRQRLLRARGQHGPGFVGKRLEVGLTPWRHPGGRGCQPPPPIERPETGRNGGKFRHDETMAALALFGKQWKPTLKLPASGQPWQRL